MPLNVWYHHQKIKLAIEATAKPLLTWLKDIFRKLLFECMWKDIKVMGQSKVSYNFLNIKEIYLWNWHWTSFTPSINLNLCSWIFVVAWNKFIYDHPGEKQQYRLFCSLAIIKEVYFTCWEKEYNCLDWCLITLQIWCKS